MGVAVQVVAGPVGAHNYMALQRPLIACERVGTCACQPRSDHPFACGMDTLIGAALGTG